jgi:hypothetical protein
LIRVAAQTLIARRRSISYTLEWYRWRCQVRRSRVGRHESMEGAERNSQVAFVLQDLPNLTIGATAPNKLLD